MVARRGVTKAQFARAVNDLFHHAKLPADPDLRDFIEVVAMKTLAMIGYAFSLDGSSEVDRVARLLFLELVRRHTCGSPPDPDPFFVVLEDLLMGNGDVGDDGNGEE